MCSEMHAMIYMAIGSSVKIGHAASVRLRGVSFIKCGSACSKKKIANDEAGEGVVIAVR